jgi:hypothetical protein
MFVNQFIAVELLLRTHLTSHEHIVRTSECFIHSNTDAHAEHDYAIEVPQ